MFAIPGYAIEREVGRGATGVVFAGRSSSGARVAVKVLKSSGSAEARERFAREMRLQGSLGDGFVPLIASGFAAERPYLVMPFLEGGTLRERLDQGALPVDESVSLAIWLARALGRAHALGIVHRDLKPENVLFTREGRPLITDLGIAKHFRLDVTGASVSVHLSKDGEVRGTWGYMPLEQFADPTNVGPPADVFALGAILYECLAGEPAFVGETVVEFMGKVDRDELTPLPSARPDAPSWLVPIVRKALARDALGRFRTGEELAQALEARSAGEGAFELEPAKDSSKDAGSSKAPALIAVAVALALGLAALIVVPRWRASSQKSEAARIARDSRDRLAATLTAGELSRLEVDLDRAIELDAKNPIAWATRARVRLARREWEGAKKDASRALELDPKEVAAWMTRAEARSSNKEWDGCVSDATRALEIDPRNARALGLRSLAHAKRNEHDAAIADADHALEIDPRCAPALGGRAAAREMKHVDEREGLDDANRAIELEPLVAEYWVYKAELLIDLGDTDGALVAFGRLLEIDPKSLVGWANRGAVRLAKGDIEGAIADETRAIELEPTNSGPWRGRSRARAAKGDSRGALEDSTKAIEVSPGVPAVWVERGSLRLTLGDHKGAIEDHTRAIEIDATFTAAWANRGSARFGIGDFKGAIDDATRAIALDPGDVHLWFNRGVAKARSTPRDTAGAESDYRHALELTQDPSAVAMIRRELAAIGAR